MDLNIAKTKYNEKKLQKNKGYASNPEKGNSTIVVGGLPHEKPMTLRTIITRRINKSLCCCLCITIVVTFISYYIAMNYEAKLNNLDSEIVRLNTENQDLQAELDRYKSFNNVEAKISQSSLLKKAEKVVELTEVDLSAIKPLKPKYKRFSENINLSIGY